MELKKPKGELIRAAVSIDTIYGITKVDPGSRGQTKDFSRERHLSRLYNE